MNVNKKEIERYLGYYKIEADEVINNLIEECLKEIAPILSFKFSYKKMPVYFKDGIIEFANIKTNSIHLNKNLSNCTEVILLVATLGSGVDALIRKYSILNPAKQLVLSACSNAIIEELIDEKERELSLEFKKKNKYFKQRYSPGYGDFGLEFQPNFIEFLNGYKTAGVSLTKSNMLVPQKSVTAVIGISDSENKKENKCQNCDNINCEFRKG